MPRTTFDDTERKILNGKNVAVLSTLRADGTIWGTPVWFELEGDTIVINSAEGRAWPANLRERGAVSLTIVDAGNPYQYISITGEVASESHDDALDVINRLAKKYIDEDEYPWHQPGDVRVTFRIRPTRIYRNR